MLSIKDLCVSYRGVLAVRGVSFDVHEGEMVSLVGPNGSGKTTCLMAIFGAVRPVSGAITFDGVSLMGKAPEAVARLGLALVPEGRHIFGTLSVAENLKLGGIARRDSGSFESDLDRCFGLFPVLKQRYSASARVLSGGEQQQLAIARALLAHPRLMMLDEPSLGLSPKLVEQVFDVLAQLRDEGMTILLVEQNVLQAVELASRSYVLRTGSIIMAGARGELLAHPEFEAACLGF